MVLKYFLVFFAVSDLLFHHLERFLDQFSASFDVEQIHKYVIWIAYRQQSRHQIATRTFFFFVNFDLVLISLYFQISSSSGATSSQKTNNFLPVEFENGILNEDFFPSKREIEECKGDISKCENFTNYPEYVSANK